MVLKRSRPDVTIIISDVKMPGPIDGVELYRRIRSGYPGIKVVLSPGEPNAADLAVHDGFFCEAVPSRVDDQAYQVVHGLRNAPDSIAQWSQASSTKASQRSSGRSLWVLD
jgi:CheY-like chemotaxis protein